MTVLDQPYQIEIFKLGQVVHRLELELKGLGFRQPTLKPAKRYYNLKTSKKEKALEVLKPAYEKALTHPTDIWVILAKVRGSVVFAACQQCGWQGDEFTLGTFNGGWFCPNCSTDESGITLTPIQEVVTLG